LLIKIKVVDLPKLKNLNDGIMDAKKTMMDAKNKALELLEKFSTRKDALLAVDMLIVHLIAIKGKEDVAIFFLEDVKYHIINN
jgi:hypothetical protein